MNTKLTKPELVDMVLNLIAEFEDLEPDHNSIRDAKRKLGIPQNFSQVVLTCSFENIEARDPIEISDCNAYGPVRITIDGKEFLGTVVDVEDFIE
jgi:hypothetical protein